MARARETDAVRIAEVVRVEAEQARIAAEVRIASELEAEKIRAAELAREESERVRREMEVAEQLRIEAERARIVEDDRAEADRARQVAEAADQLRVEVERARIAEAARIDAERGRPEPMEEDVMDRGFRQRDEVAPRPMDYLKRFANLRVATYDGIVGFDIEAWFRQLDTAFRQMEILEYQQL